MMQNKEVSLDAFEWLNFIPKQKWCKHSFPFYSKYDVLKNTLSEIFNDTIFLHRDKPIIIMLESMRSYLMGRFAIPSEKVKNTRVR